MTTGAAKPIIVAVDDEKDNLDLLVRALFRDYQLVTFLDPVKALADIPGIAPRLILTDQRMPNLPGVELLAKLRDSGFHCPAILVTGYAANADLQRALDEKLVTAIITKPWRIGQLQSQVKSALAPAS